MWAKKDDIMEELEKAHLDYEHRKSKIINDLEILRDNTSNQSVKSIIKNSINFIKEKEI